MTRLARLATASFTLFVVSACLPPEDGPPSSAPAPVFQPGDQESLRFAEQLALQHLARSEPALADSLAVRQVQIDDAGHAFARLTQTVSGIPVFGAEAIVELAPDGNYAGMVDKLARDVRVDATVAIDPARAVELALKSQGITLEPVTSRADLQILVGHGRTASSTASSSTTLRAASRAGQWSSSTRRPATSRGPTTTCRPRETASCTT